ncbi:FixH family protein [Thiolinea disciformis]|uniref:FixH family protein n=1 Tax=Thiolinea disciformis TaxID=125614 RepID=UPI000377B4B5|nr:FixH family protein [Thiolinea disciformis]
MKPLKYVKLCSVLLSSACLNTACLSPIPSKPSWSLSQLSSKGLYQAHLSCTNLPSVGEFQDCRVRLMEINGKPLIKAEIAVDGGMPAHGHGLPTAPQVTLVNDQGVYKIEGLKFNMTGAWLLGFMIKTPEQQDKVVFDFVI